MSNERTRKDEWEDIFCHDIEAKIRKEAAK